MNTNASRIHSRISLDRIAAAKNLIDPVFLNSPQFYSESMSTQLGVKIILKVETINPIRSFKGRGAELYLSQLQSKPANLVCASEGNFGLALTFAARKRGIRTTVFVPQNMNAMKLQQLRSFGAEVRIGGEDFDVAKDFAKAFAKDRGGQFVEDGKDLAITEGAGTIAEELSRWKVPFSYVAAPLGNGALVSGIGRWMKEKSPSTRILGIAAIGAPAMSLSWHERMAVSTKEAYTIADGMGIRIPVAEAYADMKEVIDDVVLVGDESLIRAMQLLFSHHGIIAEPAGVAGLAAVIEHRHRFENTTVAIPICGGNLSGDRIRRWLVSTLG